MVPPMKLSAHLDFETYSALDVRKVGSYRYGKDPSTEVLIACYWLPDMDPDLDAPRVWLPREQGIPADLREAAESPDVVFWAHNAQFERAVWTWALRRQRTAPPIPIERWRCTAALAAASGLARSLDGALSMLGTGVRKDPDGSRLIKLFSNPRKPTQKDPRTRILPEDNPEDFRKFVRYCQQDVIGEMALHHALPELHPREQKFFELDMVMNERGLPIDIPLVEKARKVLHTLEQRIHDEVTALTGGIRATQGAKLLEYFSSKGLDLENLQAQTVRDTLEQVSDLTPDLRRLLALRVEASKASTKKLISMQACADPDDHVVQGGFLFHGAHTGRYAGKLVQPQNFIRGKLKDHQRELVFELLETGDPELFHRLYEWPIDTISQCMRGFIRAPRGYRLLVVDYTAIEARVLAWAAGETRMLRAYEKGLDVYKIMASRLFGVPVEQVTGEQRRLGKNLVLGCGYSLGATRFVEYCANLGQSVEPAFAKKAVTLYREDHPRIVASWGEIEQAVVQAIRRPGTEHEALRCRVLVRGDWLVLELPSRRELRYYRPKATPTERWGRPAHAISFLSEDKGRIHRENTYGGKLTENVVQAIARDVMREGMFAAEAAGYPVIGTVHDELLTLVPHGAGDVKELESIVCTSAKWMKGIPLGSEGFECERYRKG